MRSYPCFVDGQSDAIMSKDDEPDLIGRCSIMMGEDNCGSMDCHEEWLLKVATGSNTISRPLFKTLKSPEKFSMARAFAYLSKGGPDRGRSANPSWLPRLLPLTQFKARKVFNG
jgi:hypothetical protein